MLKKLIVPPGGSNTVHTIIHRCFLKEKDKVLEVGTSTGFTAIELAKLAGCCVKAIDVNERSLEEAKKRAERYNLKNKIDFVKADINNIPFNEKTFDIVFCGNVLSIIKNKKSALEECIKVLDTYGFLVATPMYYIKTPPKDLLEEVGNAIGSKVDMNSKEGWLDFFSSSHLELIFEKDYQFHLIPKKKIKDFVEEIFSRNHLQELPSDIYKTLKDKYLRYLYLFRENLRYVGYSIFIYQNIPKEIDKELFTSFPC